MNQDIVVHNQGKVDEFSYQIAFVKRDANGKESVYSITNYASEINVYESLFAKAMQCSVGVFDAGGLLERIALQPGDFIDIMIMKNDDSAKNFNRFEVLTISGMARIPNSNGKTYVVTGLAPPAMTNKVRNIYGAFRGVKHSDVVEKLAKELLIDRIEIEPTEGNVNYVSAGRDPFNIINTMCLHGISAEQGDQGSLYFFYEDRDSYRFKTLNKIIADAVVHEMTVSVDKNIDGVTDLSKIQHFAQLKSGSHAERISSGMLENEVLEFDVASRRVTSKAWNWQEKGQQVLALASKPSFDTTNNLSKWTSGAQEAGNRIRGLSNLVKVRSSEESFGEEGTNNLSRKYGAMMAQKAAFNQIIYSIQILGNTNIKVGDIISVTAPAMKAQGTAPELDPLFAGRFLVGDIRHRIVDGERFMSVINIFKDGYDVDYIPEDQK